MDFKEEIHAINLKLKDIVSAIKMIKERRANDKEDAADLKQQLSELTVSVNQLNLILANTDGFNDGVSKTVKTFRFIFGVLILTAIISSATFMWNINDRVTKIESEKG
jgi:hypothetical protein